MPISQQQRQNIARRANYRCEYCLLHQEQSIKSHQADHVIPQKHGGSDLDHNMAWACFLCNAAKGSEVAAYDPVTAELVPIFNPRIHLWNDHFSIANGTILAHTAIGRVTILVLQLNRPDRVAVRKLLSDNGLYP